MIRRLAVLLLLAACTAPAQAVEACWDVGWRCRDVNAYRADHGLPPLEQAGPLQQGADTWAEAMAAAGTLAHDPTAGEGYSEVVGTGVDWATVMAAFDDSPAHRAILLGDGERVGIGVARAGGRVWVVVRFT